MTNNATRQAAYRARHLHDIEGQGMRINTVVSIHAKKALERLAACYGVTQRQMLERVLDEAQTATLNQVANMPGAQGSFYDGVLRLHSDSVTQ